MILKGYDQSTGGFPLSNLSSLLSVISDRERAASGCQTSWTLATEGSKDFVRRVRELLDRQKKGVAGAGS